MFKGGRSPLLAQLEFFTGGGGGNQQIPCNGVIRNFQKRNFLWYKDIVESKNKSFGLVWHLAKILQKGEDLNQKLKSQNV